MSGTLQDGVFQYTATLPAYSEQCPWHLTHFLLEDAVHNSADLDESQVAALGFPMTFENQAASPSVGGVAEIPDVAALPSATVPADRTRTKTLALLGIRIASVALAVAAWYVRKRRAI